LYSDFYPFASLLCAYESGHRTSWHTWQHRHVASGRTGGRLESARRGVLCL